MIRGLEMVTDSWFGGSWWTSKKAPSETAKKVVLGILAFEVASLMSKVVHLWHSLSDREVQRLREEITNSVGIQKLVSNDGKYIMDLVLNEMIDNFGNLARSVSRLGKRCTDTKYHCFEHFIDDPLVKNVEWIGWEYRWKKMERKVKKMEKFVAVTMNLTQELEVLAELEQTLCRMQKNASSDRVKLFEFQQKVLWHRQEVRNLRELSPWSRTYDYVVRLLLRSLMTILERIKQVLGIDESTTMVTYNGCESIDTNCLYRSHSFSSRLHSSVFPENNNRDVSSGTLGRSFSKSLQISDKHKTKNKHQEVRYWPAALSRNFPHQKAKKLGYIGSFGGCVSSGSDSPILQSCKPISGGSLRFDNLHLLKEINAISSKSFQSFSCSNKIYSRLSLSSSKCLLAAPPYTLGDAALAPRYANIIILIEKFASTPNLIGLDVRDDLYNMLPTSIRNALRARLKSYGKNPPSFMYDASLAADWSLQLAQILEWLGPIAHNTIRWQSEQNVEEQQLVSQSNVLLVLTLHYANQAKTEAAVTELLMGLNYLCRTQREGNCRTTQPSANEIAI